MDIAAIEVAVRDIFCILEFLRSRQENYNIEACEIWIVCNRNVFGKQSKILKTIILYTVIPFSISVVV